MNCEDCRALLEEYFDDALDAQTADEVGSHLKSCDSCLAVYEMMGAEQKIYERYERDIDVTPALWAAIENRIAAEPRVEERRKLGLLSSWSRIVRSRMNSLQSLH